MGIKRVRAANPREIKRMKKKLLCLTARIQCASGKKTLQSNVKKTVTNVFDCRPAGYTFFQSVFYWSARLTTVELMPVVMLVCIHITHTTFIPPALYRRQLDQVTDFLTYLYHKFSELRYAGTPAQTHIETVVMGSSSAHILACPLRIQRLLRHCTFHSRYSAIFP